MILSFLKDGFWQSQSSRFATQSAPYVSISLSEFLFLPIAEEIRCVFDDI